MQYSYEAQEDNEMDLVEGELIEQIEQLDEGWWSGVGANGTKQGLFPANYVEIVEAEEARAATPPPPSPPPPPPAVRVYHFFRDFRAILTGLCDPRSPLHRLRHPLSLIRSLNLPPKKTLGHGQSRFMSTCLGRVSSLAHDDSLPPL